MATLTPEIAANLMQRSMTTGVPTSEFDKYGGYDAVMDLYNANNGSYSLQDVDPGFLEEASKTIMDQGYGNLATLREANVPLTLDARSKFDFTDQQLKDMSIPYEGFLQKPKPASLTGAGTSTTGQLGTGAQVMGPQLSYKDYGGGWNARQAVGAANGALMGAGNADYHSSLIKSLRQNSLTPFSTNTGVLMAPNMGASSSGNWTQPTGSSGGAFNPQVINPRAATPQEVDDWNAYNTYRTNSLTAKTPILSFAEWLAGDKTDGKPATPGTGYDPTVDFSGGA